MSAETATGSVDIDTRVKVLEEENEKLKAALVDVSFNSISYKLVNIHLIKLISVSAS